MRKPAKRHPDRHDLRWHPTRKQWFYRHPGGRFSYFTGDVAVARERWDKAKDGILGTKPQPAKGVTVAEIVDECLTLKRSLVKSGELSARHVEDCERCGEWLKERWDSRLVNHLDPADFAKLREELFVGKRVKRRSIITVSNDIRLVRMFFNFAVENHKEIDKVTFGSGFKPAGEAALKVERDKKDRVFAAAQIRALIAKASPQLKAMIYLGINCAFGPTDCGRLTWDSIKAGGWLELPRSKTGIQRRAKLWPETLKALEAVPKRGKLVFRTVHGNAWVTKGRSNPITPAFKRLTDACDVEGSFYWLRHSFCTVADEVADDNAVDTVSGHAIPTRDTRRRHYNHRGVSDVRLEAVADHVRSWLNP